MATVNDLRDSIATSLRDTSTAAKTKVVTAINWARRWVQAEYPWSWLDLGVTGIRTLGPSSYTAVTVTSGSATVTVDSNDAGQLQVTTDLTGGPKPIYPFITFGNSARFYRITARAYAAPTSTLTITPAFIGTSASDQTAKIFFREYEMPSDFAYPVAFCFEDGEVMDPTAIDEHWYIAPNPTVSTGKPSRYCLRMRNRITAVLDPIPDATYGISIEYRIALSDVVAGGSEQSLIVPSRWHLVLDDLALWRLRRDDKNDTRWPEHERLGREGLARMIAEELTIGHSTLPVAKDPRSRMGSRRLERASLDRGT